MMSSIAIMGTSDSSVTINASQHGIQPSFILNVAHGRTHQNSPFTLSLLRVRTEKGGKNVMEIHVSSYAPSSSALIHTRDRLLVQREARDASGEANVISFAAVGQAQLSTDLKLLDLPEVKLEVQKIRNETNMPLDEKNRDCHRRHGHH